MEERDFNKKELNKVTRERNQLEQSRDTYKTDYHGLKEAHTNLKTQYGVLEGQVIMYVTKEEQKKDFISSNKENILHLTPSCSFDQTNNSSITHN
jgi:hypothetical protein